MEYFFLFFKFVVLMCFFFFFFAVHCFKFANALWRDEHKESGGGVSGVAWGQD
jgi:hypothetical protein